MIVSMTVSFIAKIVSSVAIISSFSNDQTTEKVEKVENKKWYDPLISFKDYAQSKIGDTWDMYSDQEQDAIAESIKIAEEYDEKTEEEKLFEEEQSVVNVSTNTVDTEHKIVG